MLITIGEKTKEAMKILSIAEYPFTEETLKSCFREASKKAHPDMGGSSSAFVAVKNAYEHLSNLAVQSVDDTPKEDTSIDTSIFKKGVWDTCPACKGERTIISMQDELVDCQNCKGTGEIKVPCRPCSGSGRFITRSGFNVKCKACEGTGIFKNPVACPKCNSSDREKRKRYGDFWFVYFGYRSTPKGKVYQPKGIKVPCSTCRSLGKIRLNLFNSVIPEGAILK